MNLHVFKRKIIYYLEVHKKNDECFLFLQYLFQQKKRCPTHFNLFLQKCDERVPILATKYNF